MKATEHTEFHCVSLLDVSLCDGGHIVPERAASRHHMISVTSWCSPSFKLCHLYIFIYIFKSPPSVYTEHVCTDSSIYNSPVNNIALQRKRMVEQHSDFEAMWMFWGQKKKKEKSYKSGWVTAKPTTRQKKQAAAVVRKTSILQFLLIFKLPLKLSVWFLKRFWYDGGKKLWSRVWIVCFFCPQMRFMCSGNNHDSSDLVKSIQKYICINTLFKVNTYTHISLHFASGWII